jgi:hypothetical protein
MWGEESTYGTAVTPNRSLRHASGEVELGDEVIVERTIGGSRVRVLEETAQGRRRVRYRFGTPFFYKGLGLWYKHAIGSVTTTNPGVGAYLHTFNRADALPVGLTFEHEQGPDFYKLAGGRVNELLLEADAAGPPRVTIAGPAKDYTISGTGASFSPPSANILAVFHQAAFTIDTVAKQYRSLRCRIFNDLFAEDFRSGARMIYSAEPRDFLVEGTIVLVAEENAQLTKISSFLTAALNLTFTGPQIVSGHNYTLSYDLPKVRYRPTTRRIDSPTGESLIEVEFEAFKDSAEALVCTIKNDEATL